MPATSKDLAFRRWMRGTLEKLRDDTQGADDELLAMMHKLDRGEIRWVGESRFGGERRKARA